MSYCVVMYCITGLPSRRAYKPLFQIHDIRISDSPYAMVLAGTTRHLEAMNEMAKRKAISNNRINRNQSTINQINRIRPIMAGTNSNNLKGASSGLKTKNKYLADFEKLKATLTNKRGTSELLFICFVVLRRRFYELALVPDVAHTY